MFPETYEPTCAVTTGFSAPVMLTLRWMSPRVTRAVT